MAESFDAYYEWLGIPPAEQPPNHYRLLGVKVFEDDPKLIHNAADQRIAYLRTFQLGKYTDQSQQLLNKVAAARVCLADPQKKLAYDEQLQRELKPAAVAAEASPPRSSAPPAKRSWQVPAAVATGAVLICFVAALFLLRGRGKHEPPAAVAQVAAPRDSEQPSPPPSPPPGVAASAGAPKSAAGPENDRDSAPKGPVTPPAAATPAKAPSSAPPPARPAEHTMTAGHVAATASIKPEAPPPAAAASAKPAPAALPAAAGVSGKSPTVDAAASPAPSPAKPVAAPPPAVPGAMGADDFHLFVGQWNCGDIVLTLSEDFTAKNNQRPNQPATWKFENGEAHILWKSGAKTVLRRDGQGFQKLWWPLGAGLDSPGKKVHAAVKNENHQTEPAATRASRLAVMEPGFVPLFNGRNLNGWHLRNPNGPCCWTARKGELICVASQKELDLVSDEKFQDFELRLEFIMGREANSGVYLRGRYEVQLSDTAKRVPPAQACGAVFTQIAPRIQAYLGTGRWNTLDVTLVGRTVTVVMNGIKIIDSQHIARPTDRPLDSAEDQPGPIMLQCWANEFHFRNISIRPLK
jgi:hypothetical protein